MVGLRIRNIVKVFGTSFRSRDQFQPDVVWDILAKVIQNNSEFGFTDRLEVHLDHVRMPNGNSREKTKGGFLITEFNKERYCCEYSLFEFGSCINYCNAPS